MRVRPHWTSLWVFALGQGPVRQLRRLPQLLPSGGPSDKASYLESAAGYSLVLLSQATCRLLGTREPCAVAPVLPGQGVPYTLEVHRSRGDTYRDNEIWKRSVI